MTGGSPGEDGPPPIFTRYGFTRTGDPERPLELTPYPEVCAHGALRATVVASAIDLVGGFATRAIAGSDAIFTADLSLRIPEPGLPTRLVAHAEALRTGRRQVTTAVRLQAEAGLYAYGETTFTRIVRREAGPDATTLATPDTLAFCPLKRPLAEEVGIEILEAGHVRLPLHANLRNPEGVLQGALVALVTECAALELADAEHARPQVVRALDLRYLATAAEGPVEGRAVWIGDAREGMIRVALHDRGRAIQTSSAFVHVADAPGVS